jgi:hypothetical protein
MGRSYSRFVFKTIRRISVNFSIRKLSGGFDIGSHRSNVSTTLHYALMKCYRFSVKWFIVKTSAVAIKYRSHLELQFGGYFDTENKK